MQKILRIFLSSVGQMMDEERNTIRDLIWKSGHIPIAMEAFTGNHKLNSIDVVIENLEHSDLVIFVMGFTYGSTIGKSLQCPTCPIKETCPNAKSRAKSCTISYTHFEYLYVKQKNLLHYCIIQENIDDIDKFQKRLNAYAKSLRNKGEQSTIKSRLLKDWTSMKQIKLTQDDALKRWSCFYDANNPSGIKAAITAAYHSFSERFSSDTDAIHGLIDGKELISKVRKIEELQKKIDEIEALNLEYQKRSIFAPSLKTAITGTCIPFQYNATTNEIDTYLICNNAYTSNMRYMFPGGHAFRNDDSPEAVAISKALTEAGLEVSTIDLYHSFDVSSKTEKEITRDFTVFRPPHYTYLFNQSEDARCYKSENHFYHYDAVYVFEIKKVHNDLECTQNRIRITLPNKPLNVTFIHKEVKKVIESNNLINNCDYSVADKIIHMLYEAHRDYVEYLKITLNM